MSYTVTDEAALPIHPRQNLTPGWYHATLHIKNGEPAAYQAFVANNQGKIVTRKSMRETPHTFWPWQNDDPQFDYVIFEVKEPLTWTLPGFPSIAPKGIETSYSDLVQAPPPPKGLLDKLSDFYDIEGKGTGPLATLGKAGNVIIWGGTALILLKLGMFLMAKPTPRKAATTSASRLPMLPPPPSSPPARPQQTVLMRRP